MSESVDNVTKDMIAKISNGDSISDAELDKMINFFRKLEAMLSIMGPEYGLMLKDVWRKLDCLNGFRYWRGNKGDD